MLIYKIILTVLISHLPLALNAQSTWEVTREINIEGLDSGSELTNFDVSQSGEFYALDQLNNRLIRISKNGNVAGFRGGFGWQEEQFDSPSDIWVTSLDVFVSDKNNHRIQRYDRELNFISILDGSGVIGDGDFEYPGGVAQSARGNLYVSDPFNGKLLKYSREGKFLFEFGGIGYAEGNTIEPRSIGITPNEKVIVADVERNELLYYDEFGNYLLSKGKGIIKAPTALSIGSDGDVFLLDVETNSIFIFKENGSAYSEIRLSDFKSLLTTPTDIAVKNDELYILDSSSNKILQLKKR